MNTKKHKNIQLIFGTGLYMILFGDVGAGLGGCGFGTILEGFGGRGLLVGLLIIFSF